MSYAQQQRFDTSIAPAYHVHRPNFQMVQQCCKIVGHLLVGQVVPAILGSPLVTTVHGNHFISLAKVCDLRTKVRDAATISVHQQKRLTNSVNFEVQLNAVMSEGATDGAIGSIPDSRF